MEFAFNFTYGYRTEMKDGDRHAPNPENAHTAARIYAFEAALGFWRGLGMRIGLPILDVDFGNDTGDNHDVDVGDLWFRVGYTWATGNKRGIFRVGGSLGLSLPTGGRLAADLTSNASFASKTVNPLFQVNLAYDFRFGLGFFAVADVRWVPYAHEGTQSGSAFTYGGGIRYRLFKRLYPSVGVYGLHRLPDEVPAAPPMIGTMEMNGIDSLYVAVGLAYSFQYKPLRGLSLHATLMIPAYHYARNPQLVEKLDFTIGIRYGFDAWKPKGAPPPPSPGPPDPLQRQIASQ